ncbi:MAG: hypothetical protein ACEQSL_00680 [Sediminibacterium sp.]
MEMIPFYEMIRQMRTLSREGFAVPHDYEFVKADLKRGTGGNFMKLRQVIVSGLKKKKSPGTKHKEKLMNTIARDTRNPHHYEHSTMNLYDSISQKITTVHVRLIDKFDNKQVIY